MDAPNDGLTRSLEVRLLRPAYLKSGVLLDRVIPPSLSMHTKLQNQLVGDGERSHHTTIPNLADVTAARF